MYLQWLVPHETAAISAQVLCTSYNHAPCHFMQSHIRKVYACLAVTCHLHFWQNDRDLLRATAVTRGWNRYWNKSQHRKSTLEKKIPPPLLLGFEPATFQARVWHSYHWAIPVALCPQNPWDLLGMGSPGRTPRLSHSSWAVNASVTHFSKSVTWFLVFFCTSIYRCECSSINQRQTNISIKLWGVKLLTLPMTPFIDLSIYLAKGLLTTSWYLKQSNNSMLTYATDALPLYGIGIMTPKTSFTHI